MLPPQFAGDPRHLIKAEPLPDWFIRDMGERLYEATPKRRWRFPVWPGFRLELKLIAVNGGPRV